MGLHLILWDAFAGLVHKPEVETAPSHTLPLTGSSSISLARLRNVKRRSSND